MRHTCPFCGRTCDRSARSALADPFCHHCITDRVRASGHIVGGEVVKVEEVPPGSGYVRVVVRFLDNDAIEQSDAEGEA